MAIVLQGNFHLKSNEDIHELFDKSRKKDQ